MASCQKKALKGEAFCAQHMRGCPRTSPLSGSEPLFDPDHWNKKQSIQQSHNCFSYAMNVNDPKQIAACEENLNCNVGFHQPGYASDHEGFSSKKPKTCSNMVARMFGDTPNLKMTTFDKRCPKGTSKIALVVDESDDYHYLRQDSNKFWSQKSGARPVTNLDASDHKIWDPQLCDLDFRKKDSDLNYDIFCGYLCVPRNEPLYIKAGGKRTRVRKRLSRTRRHALR